MHWLHLLPTQCKACRSAGVCCMTRAQAEQCASGGLRLSGGQRLAHGMCGLRLLVWLCVCGLLNGKDGRATSLGWSQITSIAQAVISMEVNIPHKCCLWWLVSI